MFHIDRVNCVSTFSALDKKVARFAEEFCLEAVLRLYKYRDGLDFL